jgi:hypothetical protein
VVYCPVMLKQFSIRASSLVSVCLRKLVYIPGAELRGFRRTDTDFFVWGGGGCGGDWGARRRHRLAGV